MINTRMVPSKSPTEQRPPHEATLYCTDCDHTSRINGNWIIEVHADYVGYECPECGTTIDSRRNRADLISQSGGTLQFEDAG
jgi:predicted RNA-binding Zn-ribbon protein involved in translation (DUF1610 family)